MKIYKFVHWIEYWYKKKTAKTQEKLNSILDLAVNRFNKDIDKEQQEDFKGSSTKFIRTYSFILQIAPFTDIELHKLFVYLNYLLKKFEKIAPYYIRRRLFGG